MPIQKKRGIKLTCQNEECGERFYDLNRKPIVCPICQAEYVVVPIVAKPEVVTKKVNFNEKIKDKDTETTADNDSETTTGPDDETAVDNDDDTTTGPDDSDLVLELDDDDEEPSSEVKSTKIISEKD